MQAVKKLGLIINPIAGMGGKIALKGTDTAETLALALAGGAVAEAPAKALRALKLLLQCNVDFELLTCRGAMGEDACRKVGLACKTVYSFGGNTTAEDSFKAATTLMAAGVSLLLFAGGDGTARDIYRAIGQNVPVIGVPAGVKIQSAVFAINPEAAGRLASYVLEQAHPQYSPREVVDLDEEQYRLNHIRAKLYGYMAVPARSSQMQSMKVSGIGCDEKLLKGAADYIIARMQPDCYYAIGPGTTAKSIMKGLNLPYELLGVDVIHQGGLVAGDVTERQLLEIAQGNPLKIVVSPIGGQGFIFGRGNHQFSSPLLNKIGKENITVISTQEKLISLKENTLRIDCGDVETDKMLSGYYTVACGYGYSLVMSCV